MYVMENKYDITAASALTGLSPNLIRAWERRYSAVTPERSSTNRRLYSESDIEKLRLLKKGTDSGLTISTICGLPLEKIKHLVLGEKFSDNPEVTNQYRDYEYHLGNCFDAIEKIDANMLQVSLGKASIYLTDYEVINELIVPLVSRVLELSKRGIFNRLQLNLVINVSALFLENLINSITILPNNKKVYFLSLNQTLTKLSLLIAGSLCKIKGYETENLDLNNIDNLIANSNHSNGNNVIIVITLFPDEAAELINNIDYLESKFGKNTNYRLLALCHGTLKQIIENKNITTIDVGDIEKIRGLYND